MEPWSRALQPERIGTGPPGTGCHRVLDCIPRRFIPDNSSFFQPYYDRRYGAIYLSQATIGTDNGVLFLPK